MNPEEKLQVTILDDTIHTETPHGRAIRRIVRGIEDFGITVSDISSQADARAAASNLPEIDCVLINWNLGGDTPEKHQVTAGIIHEIRQRNEEIPIFLMGEPTSAAPTTLTIDMIKEINEYIWVMEDTPEFIAGRITAAAKRYRQRLLPPFFGALVRFSDGFRVFVAHARPSRGDGLPQIGPRASLLHSSANGSPAPISRSRSGTRVPPRPLGTRSARQSGYGVRCSAPT